jgi:class 3 adenylate cyclase
MMVAPLLYRNEVFGFIHLDTQDRVKKFTPDDLNLLAGISSNAAIFLKNLNLFDEIKKETEARSNLQRYFSPELAKKMVSGEIDLKLGGTLANGTVFFSDIVGFTSMSETMAPDAVVEKINKYFKYMVDIVFKYNGSIDKFMGDAIMAIWGVPVALKEEAVLAITAGVEMQNAVYLLNSDFIVAKEMELHMGIGLNSGHFTSGNMGSEKRMEYTCIGDNVNLAQRVESKAGRGHVFISETTFDRAKGKCIAIKLKPTRVKGKAQPVTIYSVRGVAAPQTRDQGLFITSIPFRTGPDANSPEGLLIKTKLLGDNLILGLCLLRELPKGDKCEIHLAVPEMPKCKLSFDVQGEVPIQSGTARCVKGVFSVAGTPLQQLFTDLVFTSDKTPEDIPRGGPAASASSTEH